MTAALIGIIGALAGLLVGSSFTFWSTRRSELAGALIAATVLTEELTALQARTETGIPRDTDRLRTVWNDHRAALIQHIRPDDFQALGAAFARAAEDEDSSPSTDDLVTQMDELTRVFWGAHQAFILTPLLDYLRGNTLSERLNRVVSSPSR